MKRFISLLSLVVFAVVLILGSGYAIAQQKAISSDCEKAFRDMDQGDKGYLTERDFEMTSHEPGKHKGYPVGTTMDKTRFQQLDKAGDGKVTLQEFCNQ